jgi:site-specific DNA-methyltransferase (adenine-specific)
MTIRELYNKADYKDELGMCFNDDCLERMKDIPDKSIDMILCDLPYGTTKNKWDSVINLELLWKQYKRIIKNRGAIVLFSQTPFDKVLGFSNLDMLKYEWIWEKPMATGRLNCNFAPMKAHENILIFSKSASCYVKDGNKAMIYNPQMIEGKPYRAISGRASTNYDTKWSKEQLTVNNGTRYPRDVQKFSHDKNKLHPTQKPVKLLEYLIKTYTNENELVLDNCMGSGSTCVACKNTNRKYIGIELDKKYFDIAVERIKNI